MTQEGLNELVAKDNPLKPTKIGKEIISEIADRLDKMGIPPTDSNIVRYIKTFGC